MRNVTHHEGFDALRHPVNSTPDTVRVFQQLLTEWAAAIVANDADQIDSFIEPQWELVTPEGGPLRRAQFLHVVREGDLTHSSMTFDVRSAQLYGNTAVVVAHGTNHGHYQLQPFSADEWATEVFVNREGKW